MAGYLSQVIRPPRFFESPDDHHIETLRDHVPYRWRNGQRDSVESIGEILGEAREHQLYRKVGCESWAEYCSAYLNAPAEAMDELIEGVRILQRESAGPISEDDARRAAAKKAIENAPVLPEREIGVEGGKAGPGRGKKTGISDTRFQRGWNPEYLAARIKRDAPEIADRIEDFPSIKAAARAAGIIKTETPMTIIRRAWKKASASERDQIIAWINQQMTGAT